jgi:hypothetical protein
MSTDFSKQSNLAPRYGRLLLALLLGLFIGWLLVKAVYAQNAPTLLTLPDEPDYVLGEPCGSGELLPEWTLCLHGEIAMVEAGQPLLLTDVPITVTYGHSFVTGTTFVHPGYTTPTYGIDISSIEPEFLKPITLTANISGVQITRQIIVHPDFRTQNQRFDLWIPTIGALDPAPVWGSVIEFSAYGPVTGAMVTATANDHTVTVTTGLQFANEQPIYVLSQADIDALGVIASDLLTLTALYGDNRDQRVIVLESSPQHINFVTGWKCAGFDPLPRTSGGEGMPRTSGGEGMPRTSGGEGMPNVACFWGYGVVDGTPKPGVSVWLEISGTLYEASTQIYAGETLPRYGIGLWGGQAISEHLILATAVYSDYVANRQVTATLDANLSQQVDLSISGAEPLSGGPYGGSVTSLAFTPDFSRIQGTGSAWLVVSGAQDNVYRRSAGALAWELDNVGIEGYRFASIAASPDCAESTGTGSLWAHARSPDQNTVIARRSCGTGIWQAVHTLPVADSEAEIYISDNYAENRNQGSVWAAIASGYLYSYSLSLDRWYDVHLPPLRNGIQAFAASPDYEPDDATGELWVATQGTGLGLAAYRRFVYTSTWELIADGLPGSDQPRAHALAFALTGELWLGTTKGVYKLPGDSSTWEKQGRLGDYMLEAIYDLTLSSDFDEELGRGYVFVASSEGAFRLQAGTLRWQYLGRPNFREYGNRLALSPDFNEANYQGTLLVGFSRFGLFEYRNNSWYDANIGLLHRSIAGLSVLGDSHNQSNPGSIWAASWGGIYVSTDGGFDWARLDDSCTEHIGGEVFAVSPDYDEISAAGSVWVFPGYDRILRWPAGGTAWNQGLMLRNVNGIVFTPNYNQTLEEGHIYVWTHSSSGIPYRSFGSGEEWISITIGLSDPPRVSDLRVTPDYNESIGVGSVWANTNSGIHRLPAGATSWVTVTTGSPLVGNLTFSSDYSESNNLGVVVGTSGQDVYQRFQNGDGRWQKVGSSLPVTYSLNAVAISPDYNGINKGTIWVGGSHGVYVLQPGRHNWIHIDAVNYNVTEIVLYPSYQTDRILFLATGNGVVRYVLPAADLYVSLVSPPRLFPASIATYTVAYGNSGLKDAWDSVLTIGYSPGIEVLNSSLPISNITPLQWHLGSIPAGMQQHLTITVQLSSTLEPNDTVTVTAKIQSETPDDFQINNQATHDDRIIAPDHADVRVSLAGPTTLVPGTDAAYTLWADNIGGLDAQMTTLTVDLPFSLVYENANPTPMALSPPVWELGLLDAGATPLRIMLTTTVASTLSQGVNIAVTAFITTATPDANPFNNSAIVTASTSLTDALTLIMVAPERLTAHYGASPLLAKLYQLAAHPRVRGAVVDVLSDSTVRTAYDAWDANPASVSQANEVAEAIRAIIEKYTIIYPNLQYIVFVGNDEMLPFYRVRDQNTTRWHERNYCPQIPSGTVRTASCANYFLTDDFYTNRTPTYPTSPFWHDGHPLYLPDFASGRLVETPEEMISAIEAFLESNGELTLDPALVGTHDYLVDDLGILQCEKLQTAGFTTTCTMRQRDFFRSYTLQSPWGSHWAAFHSNHRNLGQLSAIDIRDGIAGHLLSLVTTIGCHSGMSVNDTDYLHLSYDLPQACQQRGWILIAPTAYAYASFLGIEYSEALMVKFTEQLLLNDVQEIGQSLIRAKQIYYADRAWFDYNDEKVLLPMTLYGLPMTRVMLPTDVRVHMAEEPVSIPSQNLEHVTLLTYTLENVSLTAHTTENGTYYTYKGQSIAQDGYPVQPHTSIPLPSTVEERSVRGIRLRSATYTQITPFTPIIAQSWALSALGTELAAEPRPVLEGWDRSLPHRLGHFQGLKESDTTLNITLGAFNIGTETLYKYTALEVEVFYGDNEDYTAPEIVESASYSTPTGYFFYAIVEDDNDVWEVTALCDDGEGTWSQIPLELSVEEIWMGRIENPVTRYYLQAVDANGNVIQTPWHIPGIRHNLYLPLILR